MNDITVAGRRPHLLLALVGIAGSWACARTGDPAETRQHRGGHAAETEHEEQHAHAGHEHGSVGDLDRSVEELFAASCEHGIPAHACDECRYEVGVVRVDGALVERGLIQVETVAEHALPSELKLTGEIRFDDRRVSRLSSQVEGVVKRVPAELGARVEAGQALVELESAVLAEAQGDHLDALAGRALTARTLERQQSLRDQGITSQREHLEAQQAHEAAGIRVNSSRQRLLRLGMSATAVAGLERRGQAGATGAVAIRAPFSGQVLALRAVRGERLEPGAEAIVVGDTGTLWVWVDLYESQLSSVRSAMSRGPVPASVAVRAFPGETFAGILDLVGPVMDETTRVLKARVVLENPGDQLKPGMFATVGLDLDGGERCVAVPEEAVLADEGRSFVFVHHHDDYYVRRPVRTGRKPGGLLEIADGLGAGQRVVTRGAFLLKSDVLRAKMGEGCAH
jgi:cobalt-zinc-cadmium efflux system membrane fusion protein